MVDNWICSDDQISCEVLGMVLFFPLYWTSYHAVMLQVYDHMMTHKISETWCSTCSLSQSQLSCWDVPMQRICSLIWLLQTFCLYSFELLATEYWFEPGTHGRGTQESNAGRLQRTQGWSLKHRSLDGVEAFQAEIWTMDFHRGSFLGTISWVHKDAAPQRGQISWVALAKETLC